MMNKHGRPFVGQNKKGKATQLELQLLVKQYAPRVPYEHPLRMQIVYRFPMRKSEKKWKRDRPAIPCDKRPDADNLAKGLIDAMGKVGFFRDDSQIYDLKITKLYAQRTGIAVSIKEIDEACIGHFDLF